MTMFAAFFAVRTIKFVGRDDPFFSMMNIGLDAEALAEPIDLLEGNYFFVIQKLDPRAGRLQVEAYS